MKKVFLLIGFVCLSFLGTSQGVKTPAPSPSQTIKQDFGLASVEINYSRPATKGRKIFGDIVPFGKLWRTGANSPTKITFGEDVTIAGKDTVGGIIRDIEDDFWYRDAKDKFRTNIDKALNYETLNTIFLLILFP